MLKKLSEIIAEMRRDRGDDRFALTALGEDALRFGAYPTACDAVRREIRLENLRMLQSTYKRRLT